MSNAAKARILKLDETIEYNRRVIWMEALEMNGILPVTFYAERKPFLRFDCENRVLMMEMRAEYYGKTWRCWDRIPEGQDVPEWEPV